MKAYVKLLGLVVLLASGFLAVRLTPLGDQLTFDNVLALLETLRSHPLAPLVFVLGREAYIDPVLPFFDSIGRHTIVITARRFSGAGMKVPAVPRAAQHAVLNASFAQRSALVRTLVVKRTELPLEMHEANVSPLRSNRADASLWKLGSVF